MFKIVFIGGAEDIGQSLTYFEYRGEAILVDSGMDFPGELSNFGVTKICSDYNYIRQNINKIKGLFLTHIHEDHAGGLKQFVSKLNIPIYSDELSLEFVKTRHEIRGKVDFRPINEMKEIVFNHFSIVPLKVEHSVLTSFAYLVKTKSGNVVFTGDFKIGKDKDDVEKCLKKFKVAKNPLLLVSESTSSDKDGYSKHEADIYANINECIRAHKDNILIITTFASNMDRVKNIIEMSANQHRKIYIMGKSMEFAVKFLVTKGIVSGENITHMSDAKKITIPDGAIVLSTGCQGEEHAGLSKLIDMLRTRNKKTVLFSSSVIPGNEKSVHKIKIKLAKNNFEIISGDEYHASGHAAKEEFKALFAYLNPKYFIPVHGDYFRLHANKENAILSGINNENIIIPENGTMVKLKKNNMALSSVKCGITYVSNTGDIDEKTLACRREIASNGLITFFIVNNQLFYKCIGLTYRADLMQRLGKFKKNFKIEDGKVDIKVFDKAVHNFFSYEYRNKIMPYYELIQV